MRWLRAMLIPAAILLIVSCGGGDDDGGDATSEATTATTAEATSSGGDGGSSGGGSSVSSGDIDQLIEDLTPPNSNEVARFSAPEGTNVSFESSDSFDDLKGFYDGKLGDIGVNVTGTLTVEGAQTWIFEQDEGASGAVTISPDGDNTLVTVIVGE
ncbi:MAG: hypothetical protein R3C39_15650 [Dehalococcoidia bacterium]